MLPGDNSGIILSPLSAPSREIIDPSGGNFVTSLGGDYFPAGALAGNNNSLIYTA